MRTDETSASAGGSTRCRSTARQPQRRVIVLRETMGPNDRMERLAETWGADFFGVADLSRTRDAIFAQGGPVIAGYPRAVSIGIALFHAIVDQLPQRAERAVAVGYRHHCYDLVNQRLDHIASRLSSAVQRDGFQALPVPASKTVDDERLCGVFSHKMAAHLAGLGWIGKSCFLVTPEMGPRVRWATVLTDAPLKVTGEPMEERCGTCTECVDICPVKAFTGQPFRENESREARYDASKCDRYFAEMEEQDVVAVCGLCLSVCPRGRR
jgi:epoxyqueuosine reductase